MNSNTIINTLHKFYCSYNLDIADTIVGFLHLMSRDNSQAIYNKNEEEHSKSNREIIEIQE